MKMREDVIIIVMAKNVLVDSSSAARYLSVNDDGSCNTNDVWCGDNGRSGERKRLTIGSSCNKEVNRSSESSSEHNGVGS